jgi:hypothetical protein
MTTPAVSVPTVTPASLATVLGGSLEQARALLDAGADAGVLVRIRVGRELFWVPAESDLPT